MRDGGRGRGSLSGRLGSLGLGRLGGRLRGGGGGRRRANEEEEEGWEGRRLR